MHNSIGAVFCKTLFKILCSICSILIVCSSMISCYYWPPRMIQRLLSDTTCISQVLEHFLVSIWIFLAVLGTELFEIKTLNKEVVQSCIVICGATYLESTLFTSCWMAQRIAYNERIVILFYINPMSFFFFFASPDLLESGEHGHVPTLFKSHVGASAISPASLLGRNA